MAIIGENNFRYFKKINRLFAGSDYDYNLDQFLGIFNGQDGITYDVNFGNITANSLIASVIGDSSSTIYGDGSQLTGISADIVNLSPTAFSPLSIFNALEKNGINASNPNSLNIRNSFNTSSPMTASIRVPYLTTAGTSIYFDHGLAGELEEINDTQTTGDWTAGTNTPIIDADSTNYLQGNKSIKMSKTVAGAIDIYDTVVLSLADRNLRVSAFPNTLTNLSYLYVLLYTSAGNTVEYRFPVATLTASAWNHLTVDLDASPDVKAGTFNEGSITRVYLGALTSSSQDIEVSWSTVTAISREPFLVPGYSQAVIVRDGTNQQHISVMSEDSGLKGKYVLSDALSNNYSSDDSLITSNSGSVSGNQMIHDSTATGANALQAKVVNSLQLHGVLPRASLSSFARYYHPPLEITAFTSGTQIEAYSATNVSAYYTAGTTVIVYKRLRVNGEYQSMTGTATNNFFYATLASNSSYAGTTLSLVLADAIDPGTDETGYYIVPESILFEYCAGSKTATTFTQAVPSELLINGDNQLIFEDDFDRATTTPDLGNNWLSILDVSSAAALHTQNQAASGYLYSGCASPSSTTTTRGYRNIRTDIDFSKFSTYKITGAVKFKVDYYASAHGQYSSSVLFLVGADNTTVDGGSGYGISLIDDNVSGTTIAYKNETTSSTATSLTEADGVKFNFEFYIEKNKIYGYYWQDGTTKPSGYSFEIGGESTISGKYFNLYLKSTCFDSKRYVSIYDFKIKRTPSSYTLKYNIPNLTNIEKLET
ncbi:MAG TPA: hypothetical protein PLZ69_00935, partial [Candidatus Pacearchaeota archaeon]|nr:hypothetical protein [Candidatus Pacearchaeota archaeon]